MKRIAVVGLMAAALMAAGCATTDTAGVRDRQGTAPQQAEMQTDQIQAREGASERVEQRLAREGAPERVEERLAREGASQGVEDRLAREGASQRTEERLAREGASQRVEDRLAREGASQRTEERLAVLPVYFDYDSYVLNDEGRRCLQNNLEAFLKNPQAKVRIEGHCDERGSDEYNLALGEKRAQAALEYLKKMGLPEERITIVSYGKERPADPGHGEEAWSRNRRSEFVLLEER